MIHFDGRFGGCWLINYVFFHKSYLNTYPLMQCPTLMILTYAFNRPLIWLCTVNKNNKYHGVDSHRPFTITCAHILDRRGSLYLKKIIEHIVHTPVRLYLLNGICKMFHFTTHQEKN